MTGRLSFACVLSLVAVALVAHLALGRARAESTVAVRVAVFAPPDSIFDTVFRAWRSQVQKETNGRVRLVLERDQDPRKLLAHATDRRADGVSLFPSELARWIPELEALSFPGAFATAERRDPALTALAPDFDSLFRKRGYTLVGWSDYGRVRFFSSAPIERPRDLAGMKAWAPPDDPLGRAIFDAAGAEVVSLDMAAVGEALAQKRVDVVPASAFAASALGWANHTAQVSDDTGVQLTGATVLETSALARLSPADREIVLRTGRRAHSLLGTKVRTADAAALSGLQRRGVRVSSFAAHAGEWEKLRKDLRGKASKGARALLTRLEKARP